MFSVNILFTDCIKFLYSNSYEDYEDVKVDIELFIKNNLPSHMKSHDLICVLCNKILTEYMICDQEHSLLKQHQKKMTIYYFVLLKSGWLPMRLIVFD